MPLGATTYYFPTLEDLVAAALDQVAGSTGDLLAEWARVLDAEPDVAAGIVRLAEHYLADRRRATVDCELYLAAARSPQLRPLAQCWLDGTRDLLAPRVGEPVAGAVTALFDGAVLHAVATGAPLDREGLELAVTLLLERDRGVAPIPGGGRSTVGDEGGTP